MAIDRTFWLALGGGAAVAGRAAGRAAARVGRAARSAYLAIDPDARRQIAQLPLLGLTMLSARRRPVAALPDDGHRPVVFVHGLGGHPGNFLPMRLWFRLRGRRRSYAVGLSAGATPEDMAAHLGDFINEVVRENQLPPHACIDLVAHSMGGLVARIALEDARTAARVATLVTLGTPHSGTYAARFADTRHLRALRPDSASIARLRAQLPWRGPPALPRLVAFWSDADVFLLPPTAARVDGAENVELRGFTHYSYLLDPTGFGRVLRAVS